MEGTNLLPVCLRQTALQRVKNCYTHFLANITMGFTVHKEPTKSVHVILVIRFEEGATRTNIFY